MDNKIEYLNTDLDLSCRSDLTPLANYFESHGVWIMHVTKGDRKWLASFETGNLKEPESNIKKMLKVIESLPDDLRLLWDRCSLRVFDIGYNCGLQPWGFNQELSAKLIARLAAVNASIRITIYPDRD